MYGFARALFIDDRMEKQMGRVNRFNFVSQQFIAICLYNIGCKYTVMVQIKARGFNVPAHQNSMLQINMIPDPVT